jgi:Dual-action HEIGH metallo-peptidase
MLCQVDLCSLASLFPRLAFTSGFQDRENWFGNIIRASLEEAVRITNQTNWNTRDIARLIRRCAELENVPLKYGRVTIKNRRNGGWKLGHCQYGTLLNPRVRMLLLIPKEPTVDSIQLAHVICHELGHAKGIRHRDMKNVRYGWVDGWRDYYGWAAEYTIAAKPEPVQRSIQDRRRETRACAEDAPQGRDESQTSHDH